MSVKTYITPSLSYVPLAETIEVVAKQQNLYIGIPREDNFDENRIVLTPESVAVLVNNGHKVVIEHNAGIGSFFYDHDYSTVGAIITYEKKEVYKAHIIVKSAPILEQEIEWMQANQVVFSPIHVPILQANLIEQLMQKRIIAIAFESIKDDSGTYPIVRAMSEIAGSS